MLVVIWILLDAGRTGSDVRQVAARLVALTAEAQDALGGVPAAVISRFPAMVGRRRSTESADTHVQAETTLFLLDGADHHAHYISREHFAIEYDAGRFSVVDLRSTCGTIVAGRRIGGNHEGGQGELRDQDEIVIGTASSRYAFRFEVCTD